MNKKYNTHAKGYHHLGGGSNCYSSHKKLYLPKCQVCLKHYSSEKLEQYTSVPDVLNEEYFEKLIGYRLDDVE